MKLVYFQFQVGLIRVEAKLATVIKEYAITFLLVFIVLFIILLVLKKRQNKG